MDRSKVFVVALVAVIVGVAGGYFLGLAQRPQTAPAPVSEASPASPDKARHAPTRTPEVVRPAPEAPLEALLARIETDPVPHGTGVIRGHVRFENGEPLAGVTITAAARFSAPAPERVASIEDEVAGYIRLRRWERATERTAFTGADGAYELSGMAEEASYAVSGELEGHRITRVRENVYRVAPGAVVDFSARAVAIVEVVLKMPDGSAPQHGRVGYSRLRGGSPDGSSSTTWQAPLRRLELEAGFWRITGKAGAANDDYRTEPLDLEVVLGAPPRRIELQLEGRLIIHGFVTSPAGFGPDLIQVYAQHEPPAGPPEGPAPKSARDAPAWRNRGYSFRFEDVPVGRHRVYICDSTGAISDWKDVEERDGPVQVELKMAAPTREDYIVVRMLAPDGSIANDARLHLAVQCEGSSASGGTRPLEQTDGTIWLPRKSDNTVPENMRGKDWHYRITASHKQYVSATANYERHDTHEVVLQFTEPAFLTLTTAGFSDHPGRKWLAWSLVKPDASAQSHHPKIEEAKYGDQGDPKRLAAEQRFGPLEAGAYEIVLASAMEFGSLEIQREPVQLAPGENTHSASVPRLHTLTVLLPEGAKAPHVMIVRKGASVLRGPKLPDFKDGRSVVELIPEGEWILTDGRGEVQVRVPQQGEVVFDPKPYDCLRVNAPVGGAMERLGFRDGDLVVAIDGTQISGMHRADALMQAAAESESTSWRVLRAGAEVEVAFDGRKLQAAFQEDQEPGLMPFTPTYR